MPTNVFKFIWRYLSKLKLLFFSVLAFVFIGEIFFRLALYFASQIIDALSLDEAKEIVKNKALFYSFVTVAFLITNRLTFICHVFIEAKFLPVYRAKIAKDLFDYAHRHSTSFFAEEMAGNVSSKIKTIVDNSYGMYFNILWGFLYPFSAIFLSFLFMAYVNLELAGIMLVLNVAIIYASYLASKMISPYSKIFSKEVSAEHGVLVDSITNSVAVKSFSNYIFEKKHFFKYARNVAEADRNEIKKYGVLFATQGILRALILAVFYIIPIFYWYNDKITIGDFVLVQSLLLTLSSIYNNISQNMMHFFKLHGGIRDGLELLSKPCEVIDMPNAKALKVKKADIVFDNMSYHYKGSKYLFKDFNLEIKAGEKIGLVGHSGSGKSTLVKLVSRYYDVQKGSIKIDGQDISKVTQSSLRHNIALIPQDTNLFNRTIMDNIRYGNTKATDEEVVEASKKAFIHDTIMKMPKGYQSKVGERGVMLSGGERQRIAIARAILKNAPILILDEATSALDSCSEKYIQDSMKELMKGKTVIAIAHRLSTLKEMNRLVVMDKGKIIETGSHSSLLSKKGAYHSFYKMQSQGFLKS